MRLLLDTKVFLWAMQDHSSLGVESRLLIKQAEVLYVSAASLWEVRAKEAAHKVVVPKQFIEAVSETGFSQLEIDWQAASAMGQEWLKTGDGFDCMLVIQATQNQLALLTADEALLRSYPECCIDARL